MFGGRGPDLAVGGKGSDELHGGSGADLLQGGKGDDALWGDGGDDALHAGPGDDRLDGGFGDDGLFGGPGADEVVPGPGRDVAFAGAGDDVVRVNDLCEVSAGDVLAGGPGQDVLVTPVPEAELAAAGVYLWGFEEVRVEKHACESACVAQPECSEHGACAEGEGAGEVYCQCDPGWAGDACTIECSGPGDCHAQVHRERADGSVLGIMMFGDVLFPGSDGASALSGFKAFVQAHPDTYTLGSMQDLTALDGIAFGRSVPYGKLIVHRYTQSYRGYPVVGPGGDLTMTQSGGRGVISYMGRIVDQREDYEGVVEGVIDEAQARERVLDAWESEFPGTSPEITHIELAAHAVRRRLVYAATVRADDPDRGGGGAVLLPASVDAPAQPVALTTFEGVLESPGDTPIQVRARDWDQYNLSVANTTSDTLFSFLRAWLPGGLAGMFGGQAPAAACGGQSPCVRMGDDRLHVYDKQGATDSTVLRDAASALTSTDGVFNTTAAGNLDTYRAQNTYHKIRSALTVLDRLKTCRWGHMPFWDLDSCTEPVLAIILNISQPPWTGIFRWRDRFWDEFINTPLVGGKPSELGALWGWWTGWGQPAELNAGGRALAPPTILLNQGGWRENTAYHELGHYVDWFTGPGAGGVGAYGQKLYDRTAPCPDGKPGDGCCEPGTPDEAFALVETLAQLWALAFTRTLHWEIPQGISVPLGFAGPPAGLSSHAPGGGIFFYQADSMRLSFAGMQKNSGCNPATGYPQRGLLQAFWELADGVVCEGVIDPPPCDTFIVVGEDGQQVAPVTAASEALLYALEHQPAAGGWYQLLFDHMGEYLECRYPEAFAAYVEIFGHHGIEIAQPVPRICPAICGDGVFDPNPWPDCDPWDTTYNEITCDPEQCDDGNGIDTDACTNGCTLATCGDGILWAGVETCDDGNQVDTDACTNACEPAVCGDGIVQEGVEECDDGNADEDDGCLSDCTVSCIPGTEGCRCLDMNLGETTPKMNDPQRTVFEDGRHCGQSDVVAGGTLRCVDRPNDEGDACVAMNFGQGPWARCEDTLPQPCQPQMGEVGVSYVQPITGFPQMECRFGRLPGEQEPFSGFGRCFAVGQPVDNGGEPDWFLDAYCKAEDSGLTGVKDPQEGYLCVGP